MNIIVCIKQVPDTTDVKIDPKTGTLIREGVPSIINPDDKHAIEEGLRVKEQYGGKVTVISMGPPQADDAMREALAIGVDETILLCDRAFAGADTLATSYTLATAIKKIGAYDLVICGRQAIDGDTAQIGPQIAEYLNLPQITYVRKLEIKDKMLEAERALEDGFERIQTHLPALITVIKELNKPRYPSMRGIIEAYQERKVIIWTAKDIDVDITKIGMTGSPTQVKRTFAPEPKGKTELVTGSADQAVKVLKQKLRDKNVIR